MADNVKNWRPIKSRKQPAQPQQVDVKNWRPVGKTAQPAQPQPDSSNVRAWRPVKKK